MDFSVGILYSSQEFLDDINRGIIKNKIVDFSNVFKRYSLADSKRILKTSLECNWISINIENELMVTQLGEEILKAKSVQEKLRIQIYHLISVYKPNWASVLAFGRAEALRYFSDDVKQCFAEANLLHGYSNNIILWWDKLTALSRGYNEDAKLELGRKGEKLSIQFEKNRIKKNPIWKSIESNLCGYDILSFQNSEVIKPLLIEVKTCTKISDIHFYITLNEWTTAETSENYTFHIWVILPEPTLAILSVDQIKKHIPQNNSNGEWQTVKIKISEEEFNKYKIKIEK